MKGGVRLLNYGLAAEFGPHGIRVNAIHPGVIETEMTRSDFPVVGTQEGEQTRETIPLRRFGTPEDVANVVDVPRGVRHRRVDSRRRRSVEHGLTGIESNGGS